MTIKKSRRLRSPIAVRHLRVAGSRKRVVVRIGKPRRVKRDWDCPFEISGLGSHDRIYSSFGVDSMQAMLLSFTGIRRVLEASGKKLTWVDKHGYTGFPMQISSLFGQTFTKRLERMVDAETEKHARMLIAKGEGRRSRTKNSGKEGNPA
jgi:hypothetical protein